jgi:hypothetical protein
MFWSLMGLLAATAAAATAAEHVCVLATSQKG